MWRVCVCVCGRRQIRFADPELRQRLSSTRRRDPEHNQKISDAIR